MFPLFVNKHLTGKDKNGKKLNQHEAGSAVSVEL